MTGLTDTLLAAAATCALTVATALPASAEDRNGINQVETGKVVDTGQNSISVAYNLYAYGESNNDALAVITAARIIAKTPTRASEATVEVEIEDSANSTAGETEKTKGPATLGDMLTTAAKFAGDNETYRELIEDVKAEQLRGRLRGPNRLVKNISAGRTHIIRDTFNGGELAQVTLISDGESPLDMAVFDQNDNQICSSRPTPDQLRCSWFPRWTGTFAIRIKNEGNRQNSYVLLTD